jgi:hypothetical protein
MDYHAKKAIWDTDHNPDTPTLRFPLEPLCVFLGRNKLTSDKGDMIRFWIQKQLAWSQFYETDILYGQQFDSVDWEAVHGALHQVPWMFQIWACKQVMNIAPTNGSQPWEPDLCPLCPSCGQVQETCVHILLCNHTGRVEALMHLIDLLKHWLVEVDTDPNLQECMVEYAKGRGSLTMTEICRGMDHRYWKVAEEQDAIGWRRFMEGMICRGLQGLQEIYTTVNGSNITG